MTDNVNPIPEEVHTITPHIICDDAAAAIEFYRNAFGAEEVCRMPGPDGKSVMHAELKIGDSMLYMCQACPEMGAKSPKDIGGSAVTMHMYVADVDAAFDRAVKAGAEVTTPVTDMFWGDRYGRLLDPFGHHWSLASRIEIVSPEECSKRAAEQMSCDGGCGA